VRVVLRAPSLRDEARFIEATRRSRALHGHVVHPPLTREKFRAYLRQTKQPGCDRRLIVDADSRSMLGAVSLNEIVRGSFQSAYLGYYAFEPHSGSGLMSQGVALELRRAFRQLRLHRVGSQHRAGQHALDRPGATPRVSPGGALTSLSEDRRSMARPRTLGTAPRRMEAPSRNCLRRVARDG
jgi:ribosomal-protein-alanine N-acetyltransferase